MASEHVIARCRQLYARLLRFYPKPYRERFQEPMEQTFNDICRERAASGRGVLGLAVWLCAETAKDIMREHMEPVTMRHNGIVRGIGRAALITAGALLIPLWGIFYVDGWNWDWHGFVAAGTFVFSAALAYELVAKAMSNRAYRVGVGLAVVTAFALTWVNMVLAADENPANLMYLGVVIVGVIGTAISRLRARGMARACFGTAVAQMLVPIIALVFWNTNLAFGKAVPVIGLNGLFALLFVASALLFHRAARAQHIG